MGIRGGRQGLHSTADGRRSGRAHRSGQGPSLNCSLTDNLGARLPTKKDLQPWAVGHSSGYRLLRHSQGRARKDACSRQRNNLEDRVGVLVTGATRSGSLQQMVITAQAETRRTKPTFTAHGRASRATPAALPRLGRLGCLQFQEGPH